MEIKKVVIIGSGTMGSGIAAHLCNANVPVTLLDLTTEISQKARDRIVPPWDLKPIKENLNERLGEITEELLPYDKWAKENHVFGYADTVTARLSPNERLSDYYDDIPSDLMDKINKFKEENSLMTQDWVMEPKKKVKDIIKELNSKDLKIVEFFRIKIGD